MNYTIVALVFIVLLMLYAGYSYAVNTALIKNATYLKDSSRTELDITWDKLASPGANRYHYEGWLYLKSKPSTSEYKSILCRGAKASHNQFILGLNGQELNIYANKDVSSGAMSSEPATKVVTITKNFPLQKWVYFVINVNGSSKSISCYLNGKLVTSTRVSAGLTNQLKIFQPEMRATLSIGGTNSAEAYITKFKRDPVELSPDEVWNTYLEGNGLDSYANWIGGYNASFTLFSNEGEIRKMSIL
jgi:hypothetical protein